MTIPISPYLSSEIDIGRKEGVRIAAITTLFVLYPFHFNLSQFTSVSVNMSYGDSVVGFVIFLWLSGVLGSYALPRYIKPIFGFVIAVTLSLIVNAYWPESYFALNGGIFELIKFTGGVAWMVAIYVIARNHSSKVLPLGALVSVILATVFSMITLYMLATGGVFGGQWRPSGPFRNPNLFANYLLLNVCFAGYLTQTWIANGRRWLLISLSVAAILMVASMLEAGSRGALIGLVAAIIFVVLFSNTIGLKKIAMVGVPIAITGLLSVIALSRYVGELYIMRRISRNIDTRLETWSIAFDAFLSNPLMGIGYGQFPEYLPQYRPGRSFGVHNTYLSIVTEAGIIALILFLAIIILSIFDSIELTQKDSGAIFIGAIIVGIAAQGIAADVDNFRSLWIGMGFIAAYHADVFKKEIDVKTSFQNLSNRLVEQ